MKATLTYLRSHPQHGRAPDEDSVISSTTTTVDQPTFSMALMDAYTLSMMNAPPQETVEIRVLVH